MQLVADLIREPNKWSESFRGWGPNARSWLLPRLTGSRRDESAGDLRNRDQMILRLPKPRHRRDFLGHRLLRLHQVRGQTRAEGTCPAPQTVLSGDYPEAFAVRSFVEAPHPTVRRVRQRRHLPGVPRSRDGYQHEPRALASKHHGCVC